MLRFDIKQKNSSIKNKQIHHEGLYSKNKLKRLSEGQDDPAIGDLDSSPDTKELLDIEKSKHIS